MSRRDESLDPQTEGVLSRSPVRDNSILTIQDLRLIRIAMIDVADRWYQIGLQLRINDSTLSTIKSVHRGSVDRCLTLVIVEWLRNSPDSKDCTWRKVVIAASARVGGDNPRLADDLAWQGRDYGSNVVSFPGLDNVDDTPLLNADTAFVMAALKEVPGRWDSVGIFLGLPYTVIEDCQLKDTLDEKIQEVTKAWIDRRYKVEVYGQPSWRKLVEAISHKAGGHHKRQAETLAADHPVSILQD